MENIEKAIASLRDAIKKEGPKNSVAFHLFVNNEGASYKFDVRTPEDLKNSGISMRDLNGEFIK